MRNEHRAWLEFSDAAVQKIYAVTHGNPFFAQLLCNRIYDDACELRYVQVSDRDVDAALTRVLETLGTESVSHLYTVNAKANSVELATLFLLADHDAKLAREPLTLASLLGRMSAKEDEVREALQRLVEREVVTRSAETGGFSVQMPLFAKWFQLHSPVDAAGWALLRRGEGKAT